MFAASGLYSESSTAQRGVPVPSTSGLGAGYGMRRQNSSSSSLDRMVGEDLPAMLSTVFALGSEQAPRSGAQTVGGNMRDTSPICRRNSLDGGSNTPSESGSYCCDSPPIARHPSLHKPEQGSPCGASGYQRSQTTQRCASYVLRNIIRVCHGDFTFYYSSLQESLSFLLSVGWLQ